MNRRLYFVGAITLLLCCSCLKNPVTGNKELGIISRQQEIQIGKQAYDSAAQSQGGPFVADPALTEYVCTVGLRVARQSGRPDLPYEFIIVNDSTPNAWTLPGGKIAINRGLLYELKSEAELAAVLGHEIVHAAARHGAKSIEKGLLLQGGIVALGVATQDKNYGDILLTSATVGAALISTKYGRSHEFESDHYGMIYMAKAGYNPQAAVSLQELFLQLSKKKSSWLEGLFASHPPSEDRIIANKKTAQQLQIPGATFDGKEEYEQATKNLLATKAAYESYDQGVKAFTKKAYSQAEAHAQEAISAFSDEALFWSLKGQVALAKHQAKQALGDFDTAIEKNPHYYEFYLGRAEAKKQLGDIGGAKKDAQASLALLPTGEAHELLGKLSLSTGNRKNAREHFRIASYADSPAGARARAYLKKLS